ncbi:proline-rich protein 36 [Schistocerca serialis cubense]|uniref:proline-rich protein 36 n=1 Tax=Schistocerca serialis cubense TaxID=2023355 RepID=UPI00214E9E34|nr:proline-rich protein 36 [Schistocerca serialis cubense]
MSPASQGGLELKRYIGSCLISAPRKAGVGCRGAAGEGGAALVAGCGPAPAPAPLCGLPLISLAARPGAFSRLAMHTQGAPLILAGRYGARKQGQGQRQQPQQRGQGAAAHQQPQAAARRRAPALAPAVARAAQGATEAAAAGGGRATSSDSLNTASDESSGPSENSLPRIIKPRKRRKKDRKPPPAPAVHQPAATPPPEAAAPEGSSIVTLRPYVPLCFELYDGARPPPAAATATTRRAAEPKRSEPPRSKPRPQVQVARSEDGEAARQQQQQQLQSPPAPSASPSPSVCQCRYCDPRGHIWDVRRHCYSPVLTAPPPDESPFASIPLFLSAPPAGHAADTDDGFFSDDLPTSTSPTSLSGDPEDPPADGGSALRRSWSGCSSSSSFSSSSSSSSSSPSSLAGDPGGRAHTAAVAVASQGLQVSTEIVTSPNGHRDLEIRFYSSSPPGREAAASESRVRTEAAWPATRPGGGGLWGGAGALGDEVLRLSIRAEE